MINNAKIYSTIDFRDEIFFLTKSESIVRWVVPPALRINWDNRCKPLNWMERFEEEEFIEIKPLVLIFLFPWMILKKKVKRMNRFFDEYLRSGNNWDSLKLTEEELFSLK